MKAKMLSVAAMTCFWCGWALYAAEEVPAGAKEFNEAYAAFLDGNLPAAMRKFKEVFSQADVAPDYAAHAGIMAGMLAETIGDFSQAREYFEQVRGLTNAAGVYRADAECNLVRLFFFIDDLSAASNMLVAAQASLRGLKFSPHVMQVQRLLTLYAGYLQAGRWGRRHDNPSRVNIPREMAVAQEVLARQLAEQGLTSERCFLKGARLSGQTRKYPPYPEHYFPYRWNFDDGTLSGINRTNEVGDLRVEKGVLLFKAGKGAVFGWGRIKSSDSQSPLQFGYGSGYNEKCPDLDGLKLRLRQSLPVAEWRGRVAGLQLGRLSEKESPWITVKGTNWQEVVLPVAGLHPPYGGVEICCGTAGNAVEIDWVQPCIKNGTLAFRKCLELPAAAAWAKVSLSCANSTGGDSFKLYVNGHLAVASPPDLNESQLWNYDLDPALFVKGTNVLALQSGLQPLVDGAILCVDGTYLRFDSDSSWRTGQPAADEAWTDSSYDDRHWKFAEIVPLSSQPPLFNPSWKGRLMVSPADGRREPVFSCREAVKFQIAAPFCTGTHAQVEWMLYDEMGDGVTAIDRKIQEGVLDLVPAENELGFAGGRVLLAWPPNSLASNRAYALQLTLKINADVVENYRYELAVCGPVRQPEVETQTNYTDGMDLALVWETDAAKEQPPGTFVSCDGWARPRPAPVIETPLGKFRQTWPDENLGSRGGEPCNYISFVYEIKNPGRPHVAIAEYPDDTVRCQEMRITEGGFLNGNEIGNDTVMLGLEHPLTYTLRQHHCLFFPGRRRGTVSFVAIGGERGSWSPEKAARVGKIRIYEVLNDVPARKIIDAAGPRKWLGQLAEAGPRQIFQSCFSGPAAEYIRRCGIVLEQPNFYRNWMITFVNLVKRMKFAGENAYFCGQFMYDKVLYPSEFSDNTAFGGPFPGGSLRDYGVLMAKIFAENDLGFFSAIQMSGANRITTPCSDEALTEGQPTHIQVDRQGRQVKAIGFSPNWLMPEGRSYYEKVVDELINLYAQEPGWKGILLHLYPPYNNGPIWQAGDANEPYLTSYDDATISLFEKETGITIPVDRADRQRFAKRADWLLQNARSVWTAWRCEKTGAMYAWTRDRLKAARADLEFIVYPYTFAHQGLFLPTWGENPEDALPSIFDYGRQVGVDLEKIKNDPNMILAVNVNALPDFYSWSKGQALDIGKGRWFAQREDCLAPFANDGKNGVAVRYNWYEAQPSGPIAWLWHYTAPESWPYPLDDYFADYWVNTFVRTHPRLMLHPLMDCVMWNGREPFMARFAQAFRSIPATVYRQLTGAGRDLNLRMGAGVYSNQTFVYVANLHGWDMELDLKFAKQPIHDLLTGAELTEEEWHGRLPPFSLQTFRLPGALPEPVIAAQALVSANGREMITKLLDDWEQSVAGKKPLLEKAGCFSDCAAIIHDAKTFLGAGDYAQAYDRLTDYAARQKRRLFERHQFVGFIVDGWTVSRFLPRENRKLQDIVPSAAMDPAMEWQPVAAAAGNRIYGKDVAQGRDGFVIFANRLLAPVAGEWILCLGHDGGCAVYLEAGRFYMNRAGVIPSAKIVRRCLSPLQKASMM